MFAGNGQRFWNYACLPPRDSWAAHAGMNIAENSKLNPVAEPPEIQIGGIMKKAAQTGLAVALFLVSALPSIATTFVAMTEEELVSQADAIVQGRVTEIQSFWNEGRTAILTDTRIEVEDEISGSAPGVLTVRTIGGRVGKFWLEASGEPLFRKGERHLVYLKETEDGTYRVLGYRLGQFRIRRNQEGLDIAIPMAEAGVRFIERKGQGKVALRTRALLLDQLKNQIRETAGRVRRPIER